MNNAIKHEYIEFSIRLMTEDVYRDIRCGYIYWIPGKDSPRANHFIQKYQRKLNRELRSDDAAWIDVHFRYADETIIDLFGQKEKPYFIGALLASPEYWNDGYTFLEAEITECSFEHISCACASYLRTLSNIYDNILDDKPIRLEYSHFRVTLFGETEPGLFAATLPPGIKGISGLPTRRINDELGTLIVSKIGLKLSFSNDGIKINMPALSRALYVLLLLHPEGIKPKDFKRHENDLIKLYVQAKQQKNCPKLENSIRHLTKRHNKKSLSTFRMCKSRCIDAIKKAIGDNKLCQPYLITLNSKKTLIIPIASKQELFQIPPLDLV